MGAKKIYSVGELEILACVLCIEKWPMYLFGGPFTHKTDHQHTTTLLIGIWYGQKTYQNIKVVRLDGSEYIKTEFYLKKYNKVAVSISRLVLQRRGDKKKIYFDEEEVQQIYYECCNDSRGTGKRNN